MAGCSKFSRRLPLYLEAEQYPSRDIKQAQALSELTDDIKSPKLKIARNVDKT